MKESTSDSVFEIQSENKTAQLTPTSRNTLNSGLRKIRDRKREVGTPKKEGRRRDFLLN
jgi:hypothetical protein